MPDANTFRPEENEAANELMIYAPNVPLMRRTGATKGIWVFCFAALLAELLRVHPLPIFRSAVRSLRWPRMVIAGFTCHGASGYWTERILARLRPAALIPAILLLSERLPED
jgi:hypothetical protein